MLLRCCEVAPHWLPGMDTSKISRVKSVLSFDSLLFITCKSPCRGQIRKAQQVIKKAFRQKFTFDLCVANAVLLSFQKHTK